MRLSDKRRLPSWSGRGRAVGSQSGRMQILKRGGRGGSRGENKTWVIIRIGLLLSPKPLASVPTYLTSAVQRRNRGPRVGEAGMHPVHAP